MGIDVIVVGLGGMGSAAAHQLARRGANVTGIERFDPAHSFGSSHGGTRIIRQSYFESPEYVPLLLRSYELFDDLDRDVSEPVRVETGGLFFGDPSSQTVAGSIASSQAWGLPHEVLDSGEIHRQYPHFSPAEDEIGLFEVAAGFVRPEATVLANIQAAARFGADLRFGEQVVEWEADERGVMVRTAGKEHRADRLVLCPGAWTPQLLADLEVPVVVERQVMHWLQPVSQADSFARSPVYIHETGSEQQIYGFPMIDGPEGGVKVAFFRKGEPTHPDSVDRTVSEAESEAMRARLRRISPALTGSCVDARTCMYTTTPDHHFVISLHTKHSNVAVACGFSGHGFKFAPVVGEILADLALDGSTRHPVGLFSPTRFASRTH